MVLKGDGSFLGSRSTEHPDDQCSCSEDRKDRGHDGEQRNHRHESNSDRAGADGDPEECGAEAMTPRESSSRAAHRPVYAPSSLWEERRVGINSSWEPEHRVVDRGIDDLLVGAYDLHVHAGPDRRPRRFDTLQLVDGYVRAGFAGVVVKDHFLPTPGRAHAVKRLYPNFSCYSTLALNATVGGLNPDAVEAALESGVQWVFMPTVSAAFFRTAEGHGPTGRPHDDLTILDENGRVTAAAIEIIDLLAGKDVVLASGHLSPVESLALFRVARERGVERMIVTHGTINFVRMPIDIQRDIVALGGVIEHAYVSCCLKPVVSLEEIWHEIGQVGIDRCYVASDLGQPHNPAPMVGWRAAVGGLLALGATEREVRTLIADVPARIVAGLPRYSGTWIPDGWDPSPQPLANSPA